MYMAIAAPRYTINDLDLFPEDGNRYELLDGVLLVTPAPRRMHQAVAGKLQYALAKAVVESGLAHVLSPGAVVVPPNTQLQPDILVQPVTSRFEDDWSNVTEHWLAVEVLSRGSRVYDRGLKCGAYFSLGVKEVWLVNLEARCVEVFTSATESCVERTSLVWQIPTTNRTATIDLTAIFCGL